MKKILFTLTVILLLAVFCYSGYSLLRYCFDGSQTQSDYNDLAALKGTAPAPTAPAVPKETEPVQEVPGETQPQIPAGLVEMIHPTTGESVYMLPEFQELFAINPDIVGWISMEDTELDYPVVQSAPGNADYYLTRDFYRQDNAHGCIYAREECDVEKPSDNITIYGHRMYNGSMFGDLGKLKKQSYWNKHRYIQFDTLRERGTYEIFAVFQTEATLTDGFRYHLFVDAQTQAEFDEFVATCRKLALFDTGVEAEYGDKFITLSTCDYHAKNGRLVVVAKKMEE